jgi:DNA-binding GntR family transcriptional regulator
VEIDRVYDQLLKLIITLQLEPGSTVTQAYLTDLLDCGRTPLREATQRLMVEGLVVHTPNRGISISPLDIRYFAQVDEAYRFLHTEVVKLAAARRSKAQLAELQSILDSAEPLLGDRFSSPSLDVDFHCLLAEAAKNQFLADAAARIEKLAVRYVGLAYGSDDAHTHKQVWDYHQKILDAVRDQDPDGAARLMIDHIDFARSEVMNILGVSDAVPTATRG